MFSRHSCRCSGVSSTRLSLRISLNPRMALSGVRSSWLMLARNSLFRREISAICAFATSTSRFCDAISASWRCCAACSRALSMLIAAWLAMICINACSMLVKGCTSRRASVSAPTKRCGDSSGMTRHERGAYAMSSVLKRRSRVASATDTILRRCAAQPTMPSPSVKCATCPRLSLKGNVAMADSPPPSSSSRNTVAASHSTRSAAALSMKSMVSFSSRLDVKRLPTCPSRSTMTLSSIVWRV